MAGIANDLKILLGDHASITRQVRSVNVNRMMPEELHGIIDRAEKEIKPFEFTSDLKHQIIELSAGFPYFTHLLGQQSAINAFEGGENRIDKKHLASVLDSLKKGEMAAIYEELYQVGVKHSPQREILLRVFADEKEDVINSTKVYEFAKDVMGVTNPSQLMKELTAPEGFEPILVSAGERLYRFSDPVFRAYVRLRNWKFA